jgi:outer membrane lipoprotein SlyB
MFNPALASLLYACALISCVSHEPKLVQSGAQRVISKLSQSHSLNHSEERTAQIVGIPDPDQLDPMKLQRDQNKTMIQGTGLGSVLGAGAGYALGSSRGAIAGALIGGMLGNQFGQHVAMKKALAHTSEANLDAAIKESLAGNAAVRKRVNSLNSELAAYKKRIATARTQNNSKDLAKIKVELVKLEKQVGGEVASYDRGIGMQKQIVTKVRPSNTKYAKLNSTLRESTESRNALESQRKQIASLRDML